MQPMYLLLYDDTDWPMVYNGNLVCAFTILYNFNCLLIIRVYYLYIINYLLSIIFYLFL